ncbi:MAG: signal peptidase I [bacterium]|nr:signal peptidase I [bacterium]
MATLLKKRQHELSIVRDTIESVWVAIILAFVLRAFMIEAFVIPTGSMAPRLMGEHFDLTCQCGYEYSYGWRGEHVNRRDRTIASGAPCCPSCTYRLKVSNSYVNGGDRVMVMKYLYCFSDPKPFDVVVFRNPQSNANNYIKRLIGLPGETIEIVHGDIFVTPPKDKGKPRGETEIRRKPDRAQEVMWQIVFDNDYQPDLAKLKEKMSIEASRRWEPRGRGQSDLWDGLWTKSSDGRSFAFKGSADKFSYLEFKGVRYVLDDPNDERIAEANRISMMEAFEPRYGYNDNQQDIDWENNLCSDLKLSVVIRPGDAKASAECRLDSLWYSFKAVFDTDGSIAVFRRPRGTTARDEMLKPWELWIETKTSPMVPAAGCKVELAHVDNSVKVWINGEKVIDKGYTATLAELKARLLAVTEDGTPLPKPGVRIGAAGGPLGFAHLKLMRDVYYMKSTLANPTGPEFLMDFAKDLRKRSGSESPSPGHPGWGTEGYPITLKRADKEKGEDRDLDQFFVLGDNSPESLDSRGWIEAAPVLRLYDSDKKPQYQLGTVPRYNLIGKAIFVYWPSGFRLPLLPGFPIVPDVGRMRLIR